MLEPVRLTDRMPKDRGARVTFHDLCPGLDVRPTGTNPNATELPMDDLKLLSICGQHFLPVYEGMWLGAQVHYHDGGSLMVPVTAKRVEDNWETNLWRERQGHPVHPFPNRIDETSAWEVPEYSSYIIAHWVDRELRATGDPTDPARGLYEPFVVTGDYGYPTLQGYPGGFNEITVWRRDLRMPAGTATKDGDTDPITWGTSTYAENAAVLARVTLMWRSTAETLLRGIAGVTGEITWTH